MFSFLKRSPPVMSLTLAEAKFIRERLEESIKTLERNAPENIGTTEVKIKLPRKQGFLAVGKAQCR